MESGANYKKRLRKNGKERGKKPAFSYPRGDLGIFLSCFLSKELDLTISYCITLNIGPFGVKTFEKIF